LEKDNDNSAYRSFSYFINEELTDSVQGIFKAIMSYIEKTDGVDLQHLYIDGSKFEANANKYSWVWKKAAEKSRYRLCAKSMRKTLLRDEVIGKAGSSGIMKNSRGI